MKNVMFADATFAELTRDLIRNFKRLIKEELQLASREMSEKVSCYGRNAIILIIGGFVAYAGLIVLMGGLGLLAGVGFQKLGLARLLAAFVGVGGVGLVIVLVGIAFVFKGKTAITSGSLAPEKTIATIKHFQVMNGRSKPAPIKAQDGSKRSPEEIQRGILKTEDRINTELKEMAYRASPAGMKDRTVEHMRAHPYVWTTVAFVGALIGTALVVRKFRKTTWGPDRPGWFHPRRTPRVASIFDSWLRLFNVVTPGRNE